MPIACSSGLGNKLPEEKTSSNLRTAELRSDTRLRVSVPVEVAKAGVDGRQVTERTCIQDVSDFGCRFSVSFVIAKGDIVTLKILAVNATVLAHEQPRQFEIMWAQRNGKTTTVGARMIGGQKMDKAKLAEENPAPSQGTHGADS